MSTQFFVSTVSALAALVLQGFAEEPIKPIPRKIPPVGITFPTDQRHLLGHTEALRAAGDLQKHDLFPDIEVYLKAVEFAVTIGEFYKETDAAKAHDALAAATERLRSLRDGKTPWTKQTGLVVRGFRSRIDGSVQPYGVEIPDGHDFSKRAPLLVWLHGRGDKTTDLHFIYQRERKAGQFRPEGFIVLHPFGRHCLGFKSAGATDVSEAADEAQRRYQISDKRVLAGFSMGGAGAWHIGAHTPFLWSAIHPGAGFAETAQYIRLKREDYPAWYEQKLWGMYDVPDYARNFLNQPLLAYSGEIDKQKQAADVMAAALKEHGHEMRHVIGPGMGHKYHPEAITEITQFMEAVPAADRSSLPEQWSLQTRTLRHGTTPWFRMLALGEHWNDARIDLKTADGKARFTTKNVTALELHFGARPIEIDGQAIEFAEHLVLFDGEWKPAPEGHAERLAKLPGLQGPIDDVFYDPFLVVVPTSQSRFPKFQRWMEFELAHFKKRWREVFRGELLVKKDTEVTAQDIADRHVILWGDADSNALIRRMNSKLPIRWDGDRVEVGGKKFHRASYVPVFVFPNPESPKRYVVVNSGPTFREGHDRTNSLQNPKLPDWAIIDMRQDPDAFAPGRVAAADFFDEEWQLKR